MCVGVKHSQQLVPLVLDFVAWFSVCEMIVVFFPAYQCVSSLFEAVEVQLNFYFPGKGVRSLPGVRQPQGLAGFGEEQAGAGNKSRN